MEVYVGEFEGFGQAVDEEFELDRAVAEAEMDEDFAEVRGEGFFGVCVAAAGGWHGGLILWVLGVVLGVGDLVGSGEEGK